MFHFVVGLALSTAAPLPLALAKPPSAVNVKTLARSKSRAKVRRAVLAESATPSPAPTPPLQSEGAASFDDRLLRTHNVERVRLGQTPLTWSRTLANDAARWAQHLADTATFEHAEEKAGTPPQGENLWMGTLHAYSPEAMVDAWIVERELFKAGAFPDISRNGNWIDVGHYSQLIWYNTKEVGCALAANREDEYLVCRYFPAGNWDGESPLGRSSLRKR